MSWSREVLKERSHNVKNWLYIYTYTDLYISQHSEQNLKNSDRLWENIFNDT